MGNRGMFVAGFAVGYVVGTRAGRERYDQMVKYGRQVAGTPAVQKATNTVKAKANEVSKQAMAKAPDLAKSAGKQGSKMVGSAKQKATDRKSSRHGNKGGSGADADDVSADGNLVYPADDSQSSVNGVRHST